MSPTETVKDVLQKSLQPSAYIGDLPAQKADCEKRLINLAKGLSELPMSFTGDLGRIVDEDGHRFKHVPNMGRGYNPTLNFGSVYKRCIIPAHDGEACRKPVLIKKCVLTTDQAAYVRAHIARHDSFPGETWGKTRAPQHLIDRYGWMPPSSMPPQSDGDVSGDENHPPAGGRSSGPDSGARRKALSLNALKEASQNLNVQRSSVSRSALKEVSNVREGETAFDRWMQTERGKVSIAEAFYKAVNHPDFPTVASAPATAPIASALTAAASNGVYTPTPATAGTAALTASTTPTSARTFAATSTSAASTSAATTVGKKRTRVSELTRHATLFDDGSIEIFSSDDDEARPAKKQRRDRRLDVRLDPHDVAALRKLHRRILDYQRAGAALAEEVAQYTQKAVERELYYGSESD